MNYRQTTKTPTASAPRGFTLIELLVVMAIIGVLIALTAGSAVRFMGYQQKSNTKQTILKTQTLLDSQWKAAIDDARQHPYPNGVLQMAGGDPDRAQVIWIKIWLKNEFPMTFQEATTGIGAANNNYGIVLPPPPTYLAALKGVAFTNNPKPSEGSACLLLALSRARRGQTSGIGLFTSKELADTDGDGVQEIVDAWKTPLGYFRWPTGYPSTSDALPNNSPLDSVDPTKRLLDANWLGTPGGKAFQKLCHSEPVTNYIIPVIASAGPDTKMGLAGIDPMSGTPNMGNPVVPDISDNLYSYAVK